MDHERRSNYSQLHSDVAVIKNTVERIDARLFNGQIGEIHTIKNRLSALERWRSGLVGAYTAAISAVGIWLKWGR